MVTSCVALGCHNEHDARKKISYHLFPFKRPEILRLWILAVRRDKWYPSKTSHLCSEHFLDSDYELKRFCEKRSLKLDAVPSVFTFPKHLLKNMGPRRKVVKQVLDNSMPMSDYMDQVTVKEEVCCEDTEIKIEPQDDSEDEESPNDEVQCRPEEVYIKCEEETQRNFVDESVDSNS